MAIDKIIFHCAATPDSGDNIGMAEISRWHKENGWRPFKDKDGKDNWCGYHYVIRRSGKIEVGRPETQPGVHCKGYNTGSIGICYVGTRRMTEMQLHALVTLYNEIYKRHKIDIDNFFGHHEFNSGKECPGQDMVVLRAYLATKLKR
jgi:hypothetical protein